jgi:hypothetical protein
MCKLHKVTVFVMLMSILNWGFVSTLSAAVMKVGHPTAGNVHELKTSCKKKATEIKLQQVSKKSDNHCPDDSTGNCCAKSCLSCLSGMVSFAPSYSINTTFISSNEIISDSIDTYKNLITDPHLRPPQAS